MAERGDAPGDIGDVSNRDPAKKVFGDACPTIGYASRVANADLAADVRSIGHHRRCDATSTTLGRSRCRSISSVQNERIAGELRAALIT